MKKIVLILLAISLSGCGIRKVKKNALETSIKKEVSSIDTSNSEAIEAKSNNIKSSTFIEINEQRNVKKSTVIDEPVDSSKPAFIVGPDGLMIELNNSKRTTINEVDLSNNKSKDLSNTESSEKVDRSERKEAKKETTSVLKVSNREDNKETTREDFNYLWLLLLLIPIITYFYIKHKKTLN